MRETQEDILSWGERRLKKKKKKAGTDEKGKKGKTQGVTGGGKKILL